MPLAGPYTLYELERMLCDLEDARRASQDSKASSLCAVLWFMFSMCGATVLSGTTPAWACDWLGISHRGQNSHSEMHGTICRWTG